MFQDAHYIKGLLWCILDDVYEALTFNQPFVFLATTLICHGIPLFAYQSDWVSLYLSSRNFITQSCLIMTVVSFKALKLIVIAVSCLTLLYWCAFHAWITCMAWLCVYKCFTSSGLSIALATYCLIQQRAMILSHFRLACVHMPLFSLHELLLLFPVIIFYSRVCSQQMFWRLVLLALTCYFGDTVAKGCIVFHQNHCLKFACHRTKKGKASFVMLV